MKKLITFLMEIFNWVGWVTDEYSDTNALVLISVGGLLAAVAIGVMPNSSLGQHNLIYLKHPFSLYIGLIAIVVGFIQQLSDNLTKVHKIKAPKILFWILAATFVSLIVLVIGS